MKIASLFIVFFYSSAVLAQASQPVADGPAPVLLPKGVLTPYDGYLINPTLAATLDKAAKEYPLLNQKLQLQTQTITKDDSLISDLQKDKTDLSNDLQKQLQSEAAASRLDHWINAGFFAGGAVVTILLVLATGYALGAIKTK